MIKRELTHQRLLELLSYEPETGVFIWRVRRSIRALAGQVAGSPDSKKYVQIVVEGHPYRAHRLAWMYVHGRWPSLHIDHVNGIKDDNRLTNLREVSISQNCQNKRKARSDNKSGLLGVSPSDDKWAATISVKGKKQYLGRFSTPEEAHQVYLAKKREVHSTCSI